MRRNMLKFIILVISVVLGLTIAKILDILFLSNRLVPKTSFTAKVIPAEGKSDLAQLADWNKFIEKNPDKVLAYSHRGAIYRKLKEWELALADFNRAIEMNSNYSFNYLDRGLIWIELNNKQKAIEDLKTATRLMKQENNKNGYQTAQFYIKKL